MSVPNGQPPPPPLAVNEQHYSSHTDNGSIGPVIAVLAVITLLGIIAGMIGRLCTGRRIMGYCQYDFEGWVQRQCSTCIDGSIDPPRTNNNSNAAECSVTVSAHAENHQETAKQAEPEQPPQAPPSTGDS